MKKSKKLNLALSLLATGALLYGCGVKHATQTNVPNDLNPDNTPFHGKIVHYRVHKHDTLWAIASQSRIYGDPFEWPLIYKANRDVISDPDLIYPKERFKIEKGVSAQDVSEAKKLAAETPQYQPHDQPRKKLPIDYF